MEIKGYDWREICDILGIDGGNNQLDAEDKLTQKAGKEQLRIMEGRALFNELTELDKERLDQIREFLVKLSGWEHNTNKEIVAAIARAEDHCLLRWVGAGLEYLWD